ncbi:MAG: beta-aspartyl-peptidase [Treponema sp.]|nr:beta-aspartyl-peptidase [Treponema sp.]
MYLLKNALVYAPEKIGVRDILVAGGSIVAMAENLTVSMPDLETIDVKGLIVTPGLIDQHIHVTGGGGEGGPVSRVPEIPLSKLVACGTTTVVGVSGTDSVTRPISALLAKVRALTAEGISGWMYTSNYALPPSLLSKTIRDDLFLVPEVLGVKIAHSDHRSSFPTIDEMLRILSDVRVGGMISGKVGVLHIHMGDLPGGFAAFNEIIDRGIPAKHLRPTHCARNEKLFKEALVWIKERNGVVDLTSGGSCYAGSPVIAVKTAIGEVGPDNLTMSTDGGGSIPRFNAAGDMVGLGTGAPSANLEILQGLVKAGLALETVLPLVTKNPARYLELKKKGRLEAGMDADLCVFTEDLTVRHVMAKGTFLMRDKEIIVKGSFEE